MIGGRDAGLALEDPAPFDVLGTLPTPGTTMLEASAGTGKTFTIAALVTRYVADGVPIERILAVTFTRMATAELRGRVRDRLVSAQERLDLFLDTGAEPPGEDTLAALLVTGDRGDVVARRDRLCSAIANFDAATITTTHGFCHLVLAGLGTAGSVAPGSVLTETTGDTMADVVDDLYLRWILKHGPTFSLKQARAIAATAVSNPDTPITEGDAGRQTDVDVRLAEAARDETARRLMTAGLLTYDDLLVRLKESLSDPERGAAACDLLRNAYTVVLVDEFQDTDPIQWDVVRTAFGSGSTTLVMIGDPKQAIYSFRGGDVHCYLDATDSAAARFTLAENWRSDAGLLAAYDALLEPLHLGHPQIPYRRVATPPSHRAPGVSGLPVESPLRVRVVGEKGHPSIKRNNFGAAKGSAEEWIARDVADDVVRVLRSGAMLTRAPHEGEQVAPGHIAVLVKTNRQASHVEAALLEAGVPAVLGSSVNVFLTEAGRHWLALLEALEQPSSRSRAAALALTPLMGSRARDVATMDEAAWEAVHARLHEWVEVLRRHGVAALYRAVMVDSGLPQRVLRLREGPRLLTDLGHVAQLLHAETAAGMQGASALRAWLARRCSEAAGDGDVEEQSRRLESDSDAVQVLTIHRSKGLEFPIVYCPYLWDAARLPGEGDPVVFHDPGCAPGSGSSRRLDVTGRERSPSYEAHRQLACDEQRGEDLRLLYVALTRARHQAVVWWVRTRDSRTSSLGRLLMRRPGDAGAAASLRPAEVPKRLEELSAASNGQISAEECGEPNAGKWQPPESAAGDLEAAGFDRHLDRGWRRSSYSSITAAEHGEAGSVVASEPEEPGTVDEPVPDSGAAASAAAAAAAAAVPAGRGDPRELVPCQLSDAPGGTHFGTFVHHVLERVDFAAGDLVSEVAAAVAGEMAVRPADVGIEERLVEGIAAALQTPLGTVAGGISLKDVRRADRLDELSFELPLAGGERPTGSVAIDDIALLVERHLDPAGPLQGYAARLRSPGLEPRLRGYLTGSLDLVFRTGEGPGSKFFVADYKTNRLARSGEALTAWHYRSEALDAEMQQAHYPLQAILYSVALHRYLRWRMNGYRPEKHLGGVLYLFLRGMTGPECPVTDAGGCGVFAWSPPTELVTELSDLLDTGSQT